MPAFVTRNWPWPFVIEIPAVGAPRKSVTLSAESRMTRAVPAPVCEKKKSPESCCPATFSVRFFAPILKRRRGDARRGRVAVVVDGDERGVELEHQRARRT